MFELLDLDGKLQADNPTDGSIFGMDFEIRSYKDKPWPKAETGDTLGHTVTFKPLKYDQERREPANELVAHVDGYKNYDEADFKVVLPMGHA
jgi:hypothetical protein